jgi:multiple sugar transport system substrate-binding protein
MQFDHWRGYLATSTHRVGDKQSAANQSYRARPKNMLSIGLVLSLLLIVLAGCGGSGGSTSQNGQVVHLTYALWDANQQPTYQKSIDQFEQLHPNIKVTIEQNPWTQYWQKLGTEFAGNSASAPDVFWDHVAYFPQLVQEGALMNLTPLIQQDKLDLSVYYPQLLKPYQYQGNYYGLPKDWDTITLFYNKKIFQQMGLAAPDNLNWNPTDGGSFVKVLQQLTIDNNGHHADQAGFNPQSVKQYGFVSLNSDQEIYLNYIAMNGGSFLDQPFGKHFTFNQPQSVQALQFLINLISKWHVSPPASETNNASNIAQQMFARGQAAIIETGSWNTSYIASQTNFPFGVAELPAGPQGRVSVFNGLADGISAKTKHPQEAWELFKWLASPQSQQIVANNGTVWPGIQSADQDFLQYWQQKGLDVSAFLKEAQGTTVSFPITPGFNEAFTKINDIFNQMYLGQIPVQQATDNAVQQGDAVIANGGS